MPFAEVYRRQVALLVRILPAIGTEKCFALKGGTAINLFVRDLPRLSVDIDLTYLPVHGRAESLATITAALTRIATRIQNDIPGVHVNANQAEGGVTKLVVRAAGVQVVVEVTPVLRGSVFQAEQKSVRPIVEERFGFAEVQVVSFADLYAGKIVAALDRQHPRDLFDVRDLLANEGISPELRQAFIVYLISHGRPMAEVLAPPMKDIAQIYEQGFAGMTNDTVPLAALHDARSALLHQAVGSMPNEHRDFLISFESGDPDWALLGLENIALLPAVQWRQENLGKVTAEKRESLVGALKKVLEKA